MLDAADLAGGLTRGSGPAVLGVAGTLDGVNRVPLPCGQADDQAGSGNACHEIGLY